jgi:hypothetical protein
VLIIWLGHIMRMDLLGFYLVLIGVAAVIVRQWVLFFSRGRSLLNRWAQEKGFQILHSELRLADMGPFRWFTSKQQLVYFVQVRDREGSERSGWVRCGSFWRGLESDKTEVRWKD